MPPSFWPDFAAAAPAAVARLAARRAAPAAPAEAGAANAAWVGAQAPFVGPYELRGRIGEGGVASIWRAAHVHPAYAARPTVIKLLHQTHLADARLSGLFRREADVLSLIRHRNVVQTFEAGQHGGAGPHAGARYLAMEYVAGADLAHFLWRCRTKGFAVPPALLVYVAAEVLGGLAYAHALRDLHDRPLHLVHRDVNPANVLISFAGEVKLSDFGVASIRLQGDAAAQELAGKAGYFAPEQLTGAPADPRGDLYALGATLYEMLAGHALFGGTEADPDAQLLMARNRAGELPAEADFLPGHDPALVAVVRQALARDPERRFASAAAMQAALVPFAPDPLAARLLLASMVRQLFAHAYGADAAPARGGPARPTVAAAGAAAGAATAGAGAPPAAGRTPDVREGLAPLPCAVDVVVANPVAAKALAALLTEDGWEVHAFADLRVWQQTRGGLHPPAPVAIVDAALAPRDALLAAAAAQRALVRHLQVMLLAPSFDLATAALGNAWQARELWVPPFAAERVRHSVAEAFAAAAQAAGNPARDPSPRASARLALLAVADDPAYVAPSQAQAIGRGDWLAVLPDMAAAEATLDHASYDVLLLQPSRPAAEHAAALQRYRAGWGMGDVPCLWLRLPGQTAATPLPPRCAWHTVGTPWQRALDEAYASALPGQARAFVRYDVAVQAALRVEGQVFAGTTVNVSRRGLLLETRMLPSVGTEVMLSLTLPNRAIVAVRGRALRVAMAANADTATAQRAAAPAQLGVALSDFVRDGERVWLAWLKAVALAQAEVAAARAKAPWWRRALRLGLARTTP